MPPSLTSCSTAQPRPPRPPPPPGGGGSSAAGAAASLPLRDAAGAAARSGSVDGGYCDAVCRVEARDEKVQHLAAAHSLGCERL